MTPTFEQLKKGYFKIALLKALATGITATLFTTGGILLGTKLAEVVFPILYAILIGVAAGGLVGGLAFLLLKKTAKALAKRLDEGYELHEKVQTMLEYKDENREMVLLQRSNAEAQLQAKTGGKAKAGKLCLIKRRRVRGIVRKEESLFTVGAQILDKANRKIKRVSAKIDRAVHIKDKQLFFLQNIGVRILKFHIFPSFLYFVINLTLSL